MQAHLLTQLAHSHLNRKYLHPDPSSPDASAPLTRVPMTRAPLTLNPRQWRGVDATPTMSFSELHAMLKFSIAYGASFAQLLVKKIWSGQVRSRSYDVTREKPSARFQRNRE